MEASVLAACSLLVFASALGPPPPLSPDERILLSQAAALRTTGADLRGQRFPLFPRSDEDAWSPPLAPYLVALAVTREPADWHGRFSSAVIGAINVALVYAASRLLFPPWIATASAVLFALTPAHIGQARRAEDVIYFLPFVAGWIASLSAFVVTRRFAWLVAAGTSLAVSILTTPVAPLSAAAFLCLSLLVLWRLHVRGLGPYTALLAPAAVVVLGLAGWYLAHPDAYRDTMGRWAIHAAHIRFPLDGVRAQLNWNTMSNRSSLFWMTLDPSLLFFADHSGRPPFLLISAFLVPLGGLQLLRSNDVLRPLTLLVGATLATLVSATFGDFVFGRALTLTVFGALIAGVGMQYVAAQSVPWRIAAIAVAAISVLQLLL